MISHTLSTLILSSIAVTAPGFRPPAVPLVTHDPYTSCWSFSDNLYDSWPVHWTGRVHAMAGMLRIDGKTFRFMGPEAVSPQSMQQVRLEVHPTRTLYVFEAAGMRLHVTFMTPMLPDDFALLSAPVTFVTFEAESADGQEHEVALYFDATAEWCVNEADQQVTWQRSQSGGLELLRFGSKEQPILEKKGDNIRIDWGYFYVALPDDANAQSVITGHEDARKRFNRKGEIPEKDDKRQPRAANDDWPVIATVMPLGKVGATKVPRQILLAYEDVYSIEYMHEKLKPWWTKEYANFEEMLSTIHQNYGAIVEKCAAFDSELDDDARSVGGDEYAALIALGYRHTWASGKIVVGPHGEPWFFHKENFSNGCTGTVDVSYPASPFFALFAPRLLQGMLEPVFEFARSPEWPWDFAPHDVGTYPKANGQVYNAGKLEGQMPVEECGNMILMTALAAKAAGNADYAAKHWDLLTKWAHYLREKGLDPENQLCTDDFAGHLAHNTNLSLKAINAIGAYAMLSEMRGLPEAAEFKRAAQDMAAQWPAMADDGDHYRLAFDKPGTWSMKYNLVWDDFFGLGLFPDSIAEREVAHYLNVQNKYGLPLDNRKNYTKSDWLVWCASLTPSRENFEKLIAPLYLFCHETPERLPFTDWYDTTDANCIGFRARPVIGGIYMRILQNSELWNKWRERADRN